MAELRTEDITYQNYRDVYEYYATDRRRRLLTGLSFIGMRHLYTPRVTFAEGAKDEIAADLQSGARMIVAANHVRYIDHLVLAGAFQKEKTLRPIAKDSYIWGKLEYFQSEPSRAISESQGTLPVIRRSDVSSDVSNIEFGRMQIGLFTDSIHRHELGQHGTIFPEGTRNRGDRQQLMELEPGVGILAFKAMRKGLEMRVLPTALAYQLDRWRGASVFVGRPINPTNMSITEINLQLAAQLQDCVTESNNLSSSE